MPIDLSVACINPTTGALFEGRLTAKDIYEQCPILSSMPQLLGEFVKDSYENEVTSTEDTIRVTLITNFGRQKIAIVVNLTNSVLDRQAEKEKIALRFGKMLSELDGRNTHAVEKIKELTLQLSAAKAEIAHEHKEADHIREQLTKQLEDAHKELETLRALFVADTMVPSRKSRRTSPQELTMDPAPAPQ